ncbi:PcfJ domain-containing protein [Kordia sp.]|uniref:PcfJ domain-containing protein n=1 Tax=Kordia sp. TaxID=1965332 RepID=UPI0025C10396|nr:PcfJ domain-containing protein [Kordia sp.]MCH2194164.1 PcfJ domain-containing protein [Kordia sp.]
METKNIHRKHISKSRRLKEKLAAKAREAALQESLQKHNKAKKVLFPAMVEKIYEGKEISNYEYNSLASILQNHFNAISKKKHPSRRKAFKDILLHLYKKRCTKLLRNEEFLRTIYLIAWFSPAYVRDIIEWKRNSHNAEKQLKSILKHCFVTYQVPDFMYEAWTDHNSKHIAWFIDLGSGKSVKSLSKMPVRLTKKGAHQFLQAPAEYTIEMALRRAQALAFGTDELLAGRIACTALSRNNFQHEAFWETVIQFFMKQTMLDFNKMEEIIDYLSDRIRNNPEYSIKGRTIASLTRQSDAWHVEQAVNNAFQVEMFTWKPTLNSSYLFEKKEAKELKKYRLFELCSSKELIVEGRKMNHCVASYARSCCVKVTGIFSLRCISFSKGHEILATIELDIKSQTIVQAKARFNKPIAPIAKKIMNDWAVQHDLKIGKWL